MQVPPVGLVLREPAKLIGLDELENRKRFFFFMKLDESFEKSGRSMMYRSEL